MITALVFAVTAVLSAAFTWSVLMWLRAKQIMDMPNARSSHDIPTPRGGGLAITPLIVAGSSVWFGLYGGSAADWAMLSGAAILAAISWLDDRRTLPALPRFAVQIAVVATTLSLMPGSHILGGLLPSGAEKIILGLAWVWFINLYNFMDGIDGITGVETISIAVGLLVIGNGVAPAPIFAIIAATALGFLVWNWHPAKLFMGDVGSIPLGFMLGYWLLDATSLINNGWAVALILPALYWSDATFTLVRRALQRKAIWQAHREHFYQRATQGGWSHAKVSLMIALGNCALIGLGWIAVNLSVWMALPAAALTVMLILGLFWKIYTSVDHNA